MRNLTTAQVSDQLGIPQSTLRYWRHLGQGPPSFRLGSRVFYRRDDVDTWEEEQYRQTRTPGVA